MTEDGNLLFNPCFFLLYPEKVLDKYPLDPLNMNAMVPVKDPADYDAILEEYNKVWPKADPQKYPTKTYVEQI
ncbi:hypothetical protein N7510_005756 [Penicillium lagena]|uniref:uncharacterized protein n=1 Tax=Penicillium lagena TaxID=94218 RepID=UPI00254227AF|nr:uncharacterized protein N7510_005756 [Penicillium lagena]KAJ5612562.1 hypothetical protein N7510_005756 [Penicillium lagena]